MCVSSMRTRTRTNDTSRCFNIDTISDWNKLKICTIKPWTRDVRRILDDLAKCTSPQIAPLTQRGGMDTNKYPCSQPQSTTFQDRPNPIRPNS